jgi:hypothetical protein
MPRPSGTETPNPKPQTRPTLAASPAILDRLTQDLHRRGVVGEDRALRLLYLILTSRLLPHPVSAVVKGPSSGGKSYLIERTLEYFPKTAYYELSSMSERAMVYDQEPLVHRMLVLFEAKGVSEVTNYLLRSILSEGKVRYVTARRSGGGRIVEREGPTGFLTTTTSLSLHPENETRMLSIPVTDTADQTASILDAIAEGGDRPPIDPGWLDFQTWLETAEHRVFVPYAKALMAAIPPVAVRLRRDARAIMSLIQSHAILHQATRDRDDEGRIVAELEDYAAVRLLVRDLFSETVGAAVPAEVRRVVTAADMQAFATGRPATVQSIADQLGIDKSTASRHVSRGIALGFLRNAGQMQRVSAVALAEPLPAQNDLLPEPEALQLCNSAATSPRPPKE